jgi:hypothetical protein
MQEIDTVLREFMDRKALFTSIDIANEVKRRGTWIPNRDVALYMRQAVPLASGGDYLMTLTTCLLKDGRSVPAYVYHPVGTFATEYREIPQSAMSPQEFAALHPSAPNPPQPTVGASTLPQPAPPAPSSTPEVETKATGMFRNFRWPGRSNG